MVDQNAWMDFRRPYRTLGRNRTLHVCTMKPERYLVNHRADAETRKNPNLFAFLSVEKKRNGQKKTKQGYKHLLLFLCWSAEIWLHVDEHTHKKKWRVGEHRTVSIVCEGSVFLPVWTAKVPPVAFSINMPPVTVRNHDNVD